MKFPFIFKSPTAGVFSEQWQLQTHPVVCGGAALLVTLRGVALQQDKYKQQRTELEVRAVPETFLWLRSTRPNFVPWGITLSVWMGSKAHVLCNMKNKVIISYACCECENCQLGLVERDNKVSQGSCWNRQCWGLEENLKYIGVHLPHRTVPYGAHTQSHSLPQCACDVNVILDETLIQCVIVYGITSFTETFCIFPSSMGDKTLDLWKETSQKERPMRDHHTTVPVSLSLSKWSLKCHWNDVKTQYHYLELKFPVALS